jgi:chromosome segregation ATPase
MISFECPHCGNHFEVNDDLAGRDGWCRVCKNMVTIPGGTLTPAENLSAERREARFNALFRYAARKADERKVHLLDAKAENKQLRRKVEQVDALTEQLAAAESRIAHLETAVDGLDRTASTPAEQESGTAAALDERLTAVEQELENRLAGIADRLGARLAALEEGLPAVEDKAGEAAAAAKAAAESSERTDTHVRDLTERHEDLRTRVTELGEEMMSDGSRSFEQDTALAALRASMSSLRDEVLARDAERISKAEASVADLASRLEAVAADTAPAGAVEDVRARFEAMEERLNQQDFEMAAGRLEAAERMAAEAAQERESVREALDALRGELTELRDSVASVREKAKATPAAQRIEAVPVPVDEDINLVPEVVEDDQPMLESFMRFMQPPAGSDPDQA